jgi:hypothetical protein
MSHFMSLNICCDACVKLLVVYLKMDHICFDIYVTLIFVYLKMVTTNC